MGLETADQKDCGPMADKHHAEHAHGSMDIRAQEKTFAGFVRMTVWVVTIVVVILVFMGLVNA
jgi:Bacterial aa3 type cytochrome c oxidase subunit IV